MVRALINRLLIINAVAGTMRSSLTKVDEDSDITPYQYNLFAIRLVSYHIIRAAVFILLAVRV